MLPIVITTPNATAIVPVGETIDDQTVTAEITSQVLGTTITVNGSVLGGTVASGILIESLAAQGSSSTIIVGQTGVVNGTNGITLRGGSLVSGFAEASIENFGQILTTSTSAFSGAAINSGTYLSGRITSLINRVGGFIGGISANVTQLTNQGIIDGAASTALRLFTSSDVTNTGTIRATTGTSFLFASYTINALATGSTLTLNNSGIISAPSGGSNGQAIASVIANLTNTSAGSISATTAAGIAISATQQLNLNNQGTVTGALMGGNTALAGDVIVNSGTINGLIKLGAGDDSFTSTGTVAGIIDLGLGNDSVQGGAGNQRIFGGAGTDRSIYAATVGASTIVRLANGSVRVTSATDGTDILRGVETYQFSDATISLTGYAAHDANGDGDSDLIYFSQSTGLISRTDFVGGAGSGVATVGDTGSGNWDVQATGDFNYDGTTDVVLKNSASGQFYIWTLNNGVQTGGYNLGTIGTNWNIGSTGDFNGDGNHDLLWRNSSNGHVYVWTLNNAGQQIGSASLGVLGTDWNVGKAGDFDGDGDSDVLLRNSVTGQIYLYLMQNGLQSGSKNIGVFGADWGLAATGDFNGDGVSDIAIKNVTTGQFYLFLMNQDLSYNGSSLGTIGTDWNIATVGDYNKDGTDDIVWRNATTGQTYLWAMEDGHQAATGSSNVGTFAADLVIV
jgi:FG-GAP-like repeat